ncbi:MAG: hypothetical protein K8I29_19635 [Alphaproteobacteria bacterium]|uniref:Uncharacterized protein n=1 Tax=Candidatus Nitrobium versatile TaxID=2884831 RepID=A0A953M3T3_9BACT|nr:hypothetical protein [Candidatus Nitrobium versatile]
MYLNLTIEHLAGFALLAYLLIPLFHGAMAYRWTAWAALWQLLTPVRPWFFDLPLLCCSFFVLEWLYRKAIKQ